MAEWTYPTNRTPTDKELAQVLRGLPLEQRIETIIRKYVSGAMHYYDGKTPSPVVEVRITAHLMRKIRPWLTVPDPPALIPGARRSEGEHDLAARLRAKAEIEDSGPMLDDTEGQAAHEDVPEITWRDMQEIVSLLREAADRIDRLEEELHERTLAWSAAVDDLAARRSEEG